MAETIYPRGAFQHLRNAFPVSHFDRESDRCGAITVEVLPLPVKSPQCGKRDAFDVRIAPRRAAAPAWYPPWAREEGPASRSISWEGTLCLQQLGLRAETRAGRAAAADQAVGVYETHKCGALTQQRHLLSGLHRKRRRRR